MNEAAAGAAVRILIVDDHVVVRAGLRALLEGEPGFDVIEETGDGEKAVLLAERHRPDVVLMDLRLTNGDAAADADMGGISATRRITAAVPGVSVVVLTSYGTGAVDSAKTTDSAWACRGSPRGALCRVASVASRASSSACSGLPVRR
ncbi:response regulator [Streptomyces umbrinus]